MKQPDDIMLDLDDEGDERRNELRISHRAAVFVEVAGASPGAGEQASLVLCQVEDISANGLRVRIDRKLPVGSALGLVVKFPGASSALRLVAEVRWVQCGAGDACVVGFALYESLQTDIRAWKERIAETLLA